MPQSAPLFVMAFDHRVALERRFGRPGDTPGDLYIRFAAGKQIIWEATQQCAAQLTEARVGILVDEQYGSHVLSQGAQSDVVVCLPVERSLAPTFTYEHGEDYAKHVAAVRPDVVKALVFHNPGDDPEPLWEQASRLAELSRWCADVGYEFMLEVLVPPTEAQLAEVGGDHRAYDDEVRPGITLRMIEEMQRAGVAADHWKLEGFSTSADVAAVVAAARQNRETATYMLLGRAAPDEQVNQWLQSAAAVSGSGGFAIGRSIWEGPLGDFFAETSDRATAVETIRASFTAFANTYLAAAAAGAQVV